MKLYAWLLFLLVTFDTVLTVVAVKHWGAVEMNIPMRLLLNYSPILFIMLKIGSVIGLVYMAQRLKLEKYLKVAFWCYLVIYSIGIVKINTEKPVTKVKVAQPQEHWNTAVVTTYANKFEGRRMANGKVFSHSKNVIACKQGKFGSVVEIRYGKNGKSVGVISDRGGLPLHRRNRWQFDLSRHMARELGLYGRSGRVVQWRYVKKG